MVMRKDYFMNFDDLKKLFNEKADELEAIEMADRFRDNPALREVMDDPDSITFGDAKNKVKFDRPLYFYKEI